MPRLRYSEGRRVFEGRVRSTEPRRIIEEIDAKPADARRLRYQAEIEDCAKTVAKQIGFVAVLHPAPVVGGKSANKCQICGTSSVVAGRIVIAMHPL